MSIVSQSEVRRELDRLTSSLRTLGSPIEPNEYQREQGVRHRIFRLLPEQAAQFRFSQPVAALFMEQRGTLKTRVGHVR